MSNKLIPDNEFQTAVPSSDGLLTLRSTNTESPSNNDLLNTYDLTIEPILPDVEHENLPPDSDLITETNPVENIPVILYTQGTCFENLSSDALITDKDELFIYLCDVLIRFDESPNHYQKEDYEALIRTLVGSLIYLYEKDLLTTQDLIAIHAILDEINATLDTKVDKIPGKGLSTNDLTDLLKQHYDTAYTHSQSPHAPADAEKNVNADWNSESGDSKILNKPDLTQFVTYINAISDVNLGEYNLTAKQIIADSIKYNTEAIPELEPGVRRWNDKYGTTELRLKGNNVTLQDGQELHIMAYNGSGQTILNGQAVTIVGSYNDIDSIELAIASDHSNPNYRVNGIATEDIPDGETGLITWFGQVHDLDLSYFEVNDEVYLSQTTPGGLAKFEDLEIGGRYCQIGKVIDNSSTDGVLRLAILNEANVANNTLGELNVFTANDTSTGLFYFEGLTLDDDTHFNVGAAKGWIVDNESDPLNPSIKYINYPGESSIEATHITFGTITYLLLTKNNEIRQQLTYPTPAERRANIFLGNVGHPNKLALTTAMNTSDIMISPLSQVRDLFTTIPLINDGVGVVAHGVTPLPASMQLRNNQGYIYGLGINPLVLTDPNRRFIPSDGNPITFKYRTQLGGTAVGTTFVDPTLYDNNGVLQPVGSPGKRSTNQRVYILQNGEYRIQYGQKVYADLATAILAIPTEAFVTFPGIKEAGILIGVISIQNDTTDLNGGLANPAKANFTSVSKFGEAGGSTGSSGGTAGITNTLQIVYNNSTTPEIVTNTVNGALTLRNGSEYSDVNILEIENEFEQTIAEFNSNGNASFTKIIKYGGLSSQFLKADGSDGYITEDSTNLILPNNFSLSSKTVENTISKLFSLSLDISNGSPGNNLILGTPTAGNSVTIYTGGQVVGVNERVIISSSGFFGIGTSPLQELHLVRKSGGFDIRTDSYGSQSTFTLNRASGTSTNPTIPSNTASLGKIAIGIWNGSSFQDAAYITSSVEGTSGIGSLPAGLKIFVTEQGTTSPVERFRIAHNGYIGINTGSYPVLSARIHAAASGENVFAYFDSYGFGPVFKFRSASASITSPSATQIYDNLFQFTGSGYSDTSFTPNRVSIRAYALENWGLTSHGTGIVFSTTAIGTQLLKDRLFIGENIGVNTSKPLSNLQVESVVRADSLQTVGSVGFSAYESNKSWYAGEIVGYLNANNGTRVDYSGGLAFKTKKQSSYNDELPITRMVIDDSGRIGHGTINPQFGFDSLLGSARIGEINNYLKFGFDFWGGEVGFYSYNNSTSRLLIAHDYEDNIRIGGSDLDVAAIIISGTNVGIGRIPLTPLDVYTSNNQIATFESNTMIEGSILRFTVDSFGGEIGLEAEAPGFWRSLVALDVNNGNIILDVSTIVITPNQKVGISTYNPQSELDVNGVITATGGNSNYWNQKVDPALAIAYAIAL